FVFLSKYLYNHGAKEVESLKSRKDIEIKKNDLMQDISRLLAEIKGYKDVVNTKDVSNIINIIGKIARNYSIKVIYIKPAQEQNMEVFSKYFYELSGVTANYHNIGSFAEALENALEFFTVEGINLGNNDQDRDGRLNFNLRLSTIIISEK
ncbi:MAG: type 4a pilus biogenesis protein PilO, partial [Candidatus Omnitrophica bacterium]|nr:type 4a pilus biogenesis protein PilO [Candidatus Omnitrophota bacterium]